MGPKENKQPALCYSTAKRSNPHRVICTPNSSPLPATAGREGAWELRWFSDPSLPWKYDEVHLPLKVFPGHLPSPNPCQK